VAGADPVAVETLCCRYLDINPDEFIMVQKAAESKLGEKDISKLNIVEKQKD
jgi:hypothetical protein